MQCSRFGLFCKEVLTFTPRLNFHTSVIVYVRHKKVLSRSALKGDPGINRIKKIFEGETDVLENIEDEEDLDPTTLNVMKFDKAYDSHIR